MECIVASSLQFSNCCSLLITVLGCHIYIYNYTARSQDSHRQQTAVDTTRHQTALHGLVLADCMESLSKKRKTKSHFPANKVCETRMVLSDQTRRLQRSGVTID